MNYDILEKNIWWKKNKNSNKNISKKKFFSWEILPLTWHANHMLVNPLTEYSYNWYFYSCEIFKLSIFLFSQTNAVQCAKKVIIH